MEWRNNCQLDLATLCTFIAEEPISRSALFEQIAEIHISSIMWGMADEPIPLSPTVVAVFSQFLDVVDAEGIIDKEAHDRLRKALEEQKFSPEALHTALFDASE